FATSYGETKNAAYLTVLTKAVNWALNYNYEQGGIPGAEFPARVAIGLEKALPQITDTTLAGRMQSKIQSILAYIRGQQNPDGSFGTQLIYYTDYAGTTVPTIRTAQCLYALALSGASPGDPQLRGAMTWLVNQQVSSGDPSRNGGWWEHQPTNP